MQIGVGGGFTVTATERWFTELRAGRCFYAAFSVTASAGAYSHVQLWNPVGSTISAIARSVKISRTTAGRISVRQRPTALSTAGSAGFNQLIGSPNGQAALRVENNAAQQGTEMGSIDCLAGTPLDLAVEWFFELGASESILVVNNDVNVGITLLAQWMEL